MTLLTFSNLYAEEFSLNDIAVNLTCQLVGTEMIESIEGGNLVFEDPGVRKLRGGIQIFTYRQGGTNRSRHYAPVLVEK